MPDGSAKPVLIYRDPADDRHDAAEEQGRVAGYVAAAALWGLAAAVIAVILTGVAGWVLLLTVAE